MGRVPCGRMRMAVRTVVLSGIGAAVAVSALRGCMNVHYRGPGQSDITLAASPVARMLAFPAAGEGGRDLYVLDPGAGTVRRVARTPEYETEPTFTADGAGLVYAAGRPGERADHLYARPVEGGAAARQLTRGDVSDSAPCVSPDGGAVAFYRCDRYLWGGLMHGIWTDCRPYRMAIDGSAVGHVPGNRARDWSGAYWRCLPRFAPDGRKVVFPEFAPGVTAAARTAAKDTLAAGYATDWHSPVYLAATKTIYFLWESWPNGGSGVPVYTLYRIKPDGTGLTKVAGPDLFSNPIAWTPPH